MNTFGPNASLKTPPYFLRWCYFDDIHKRMRTEAKNNTRQSPVLKSRRARENRKYKKEKTGTRTASVVRRLLRAFPCTRRTSTRAAETRSSTFPSEKKEERTHLKYGYSAKKIGPPTKSSISPSTIGALSLDGLSPYVCRICVTHREMMSCIFKSRTSSGSSSSCSSSPPPGGPVATALVLIGRGRRVLVLVVLVSSAKAKKRRFDDVPMVPQR